MKYKSKEKCDPKAVKKATLIKAEPKKGGIFKRFLSKIKK